MHASCNPIGAQLYAENKNARGIRSIANSPGRKFQLSSRLKPYLTSGK